MIASKWDQYVEMVNSGVPIEEALNKLQINRYCCRRMMMTHIVLAEKMMPYSRTLMPAAEEN